MRLYRILLIVGILILVVPIAAQTGVPAEELADPDGAFVDVNGLSIYYTENGPADGPVVMLLHGFGGSTFTWRDNIAPLVEAGYRVIAYDRPPFGLSDKQPSPIDQTGTGHAAIAAGLMDALGIDSAVLVGHSAGGGVIAHTALLYPERVTGLVFVAGAVGDDRGADGSREQAEAGDSGLGGLFDLGQNIDPEAPLALALVRTFLTPERFTSILEGAYHPSFDVTDDIRAGYSRVLQVENWEAGFLTLFSSDAMPAPVNVADLAALDIPALLIWGAQDTWVPLSQGEFLHEMLPGSELVVYDNVGHMPMEEAVEAFNADLLNFVDGVYSTG